MTILQIYTDGACSGNQHDENIGGWGGILCFGPHEKEVFGGLRNTTNNRMEMTALLECFRSITKVDQLIEVYCDSAYLMDAFRRHWYLKWKANGWMNAAKKPVENRDLWEALLPYLQEHDIRFYRVKGHLKLMSTPEANREAFRQFLDWNGSALNYNDFVQAVEMNHRADRLANRGIEDIRLGQETGRG